VLALVLCASCSLRGVRPRFAIVGPVPPVTDPRISTEIAAADFGGSARILGEGGPDPMGEFTAALYQTTGARLLAGHRWRLEADGNVFDALVADIATAQVSINFVQYIWEPGDASDRLLRALAARKPRVACRVLVDPMGSHEFASRVAPRLRAIGCEPRMFRPVSITNLFERNHRKLVTFDGRIAYVGGFGVRQEWCARGRFPHSHGFGASRGLGDEWRDDNIRISGPAVTDAQRAFAQNWQEAGGVLLPAAEFPTLSPDGEARVAFIASTAGYLTDSERLVHLLLGAAQKRVYIANAYFVPDRSLVQLLLEKVKQGVDVRVLVPGRKNDLRVAEIGQRRLYGELLDGGVRIFEYQPVMMHAKTMLIDDRVAMVGSLNLNLLSFTRLEEAGLVVDDPKLVEALDASWRRDLARAREVKRR
jgi:cardiolipin synthase